MNALADAFPDAVFIETHRDPAMVVASMCSLVGALTSTFTDEDWTAYIARHWTNLLAEMTERVDRFRDAHGDMRFIDLQYSELLRDPIASMSRLYECLDRPVTAALEARWSEFLSENPQDKHGRHDYGLAELGLDRAEIDERFARHVARYEIPREEVA
jgi:LPS sulfotransferase NodH